MKRLITFLLIALMPFVANATTAYEWDGKPIKVMLEVGKERVIRFTDNIQYRFPKEAVNSVEMSTSAGILYITPKAVLEDLPLDVKLNESGEIIRIRLTAVAEPQDLDEVRITPPIEKQKKTEFAQSESVMAPNGDFSNHNEGDPVALVRYAAMRDLMPKRLWKTVPSIASVPYPKNLNIDQLFSGRMAEVLKSKITASYRSGNLVLTSIVVKNVTPYPVAIDFRDITIDTEFVSVPKPYYTLAAKDDVDQGDYGVIYIITRGAFLPHMLKVDPNALPKPKDNEKGEA
ncbi:DUF3438 family protein [Vibrio gangliei]|uniref:DUF3438 family protein n=1 Tax=Vibrio gangliei TaxID=2077090 RepID=UPI0013002C9D|nr:DUF3438 family protein [Vibrio gangliei]